MFEHYNGRCYYITLENTPNLIENGLYSDYSTLESSSAELNLLANQTVVAAYLYCAGSDKAPVRIYFYVLYLNETDHKPRTG